MGKNNNSTGGISVFALLGLIFIVLKLTGYMDNWSWWWVTAPFWGPTILVFAIFFIAYISLYIYYWILTAFKKKEKGPPKSKFQLKMEEIIKQEKQKRDGKV